MKACHCFAVLRNVRMEHLDDDPLADRRVDRLVDAAHTALAEQTDDLVLADRSPDELVHLRFVWVFNHRVGRMMDRLEVYVHRPAGGDRVRA